MLLKAERQETKYTKRCLQLHATVNHAAGQLVRQFHVCMGSSLTLCGHQIKFQPESKTATTDSFKLQKKKVSLQFTVRPKSYR